MSYNKRDLNLISYVWYQLWSPNEIPNCTKDDFKRLLREFNAGHRNPRNNNKIVNHNG